MKDVYIILTQCNDGAMQDEETIGNTFLSKVKLEDPDYFGVGDSIEAPDGSYLVGKLLQSKRGIFRNIQIGIKDNTIWYKEGWLTGEDIRKVLEEAEEYELLAALSNVSVIKTREDDKQKRESNSAI